MQRQPEDKEQSEGLLRAKEQPGGTPEVTPGLESRIASLRGGGSPLPQSSRAFFEPRFGHDFSKVRIHSDGRAAEAAQAANARAFTLGRDVVFGAGQYQPESSEGRRLIGHELTHVIQQSHQPPKIQRRIIVGGNPYTPNPLFLTDLDSRYGPHMTEFVKKMHNDGHPPDYPFSSFGQLKTEIRIRHHAIKGMKKANADPGCCDYPDHAHPYYLNSTYWDKSGLRTFIPKSPLPAGKEASDAIEAIFALGAGTRLECYATTVAIEYYSLLKGLGKDKFNALYPGGAGLEISTRIGHIPTFHTSTRKYKIVTVSSKSEILPGDWVYFKNFPDYLSKHPGGSWQGENAIYLGDGKYQGFGVDRLNEDDMNKKLVEKYNTGLPAADNKTVADLVATDCGGGRHCGLRLGNVVRPIISRLAP